MIWSIFFLSLISQTFGYCHEHSTKIKLRPSSRWDGFSSTIFNRLVDSKVCTHQQASKLLKTFNVRGLGDLSDCTHGTKSSSSSKTTTYTEGDTTYIVTDTTSTTTTDSSTYTTATLDKFSGDPEAANELYTTIKTLLNKKSNCAACKSQSAVDCADQTPEFVEAITKNAIANKVITTKNVTDLANDHGINVEVPPEPPVTPTKSDPACMQAQNDFKADCEKNYNGFADGARCFFVPDTVDRKWADAWTACQNRGGKLATVLTGSEMLKINTTLKTKQGDLWMWTTGKRLVNSLSEPGGTICSYARNSTYVFNSANDTDYNPLLIYNNTWFRGRQCNLDDTGDASPNQCIHIWAAMTRFGDLACTVALKALCEVDSPGQKFVKIDGVCSTETPILETQGSSSDDCAAACAQKPWCRSFNLINGDTCQLFTWWIDDKPNVAFKKPACVHYSYLP